MGDTSRSLRIDWFDGTVIEEFRTNPSQFADEEIEAPQVTRPQDVERKPIGFKRLLDISFMKPPSLNLELANRPGFWLLFSNELKDDYIVLILKILAALYKSLQPGDKSKISTLLKTKFIPSNFIAQLKAYLNGLPSVRIVDKRKNIQFWEDVEAFYYNLYELCKGILSYQDYDEELLKDLLDLVEITEISALGVQEEHSERIGETLYSKLLKIKEDILQAMSGDGDIIPKNTQDFVEDPTSFRNLQIFPTKDDLLGDALVNIQPNIVNGAYSSTEHYLDIQFKLLREDCFGPLREGICKYLQNPNKKRHENIRVYSKVRVISTFISNNKVGHLVDIAWEDRIKNKPVNCKMYAHNKRLMFGSLLLFTNDNFSTVTCGSVLDSSMDLLSEGYIAVAFDSPISNNVFSNQYLMVESEVFFEPYHRVLKVLQNCRPDDLPMKNYIVDIQANTKPPAYITNETIYTIKNKNDEIYFPVLDKTQWPNMDTFGLDESQMDAFHFALTREFAVIQGPPGTGKTFIGIKIASTILKNISLEGTPMLVICYTNHALDQFLEGILDITDNIVRLGSQSKSKKLENYTLHNLRSKNKSRFSYLYASKRSEMEKVFKDMSELQTDIEKCDKEVLSYKTVRPYLRPDLELKCPNEDPVLNWLFGIKDETEEEIEDWEKQCKDFEISDKIESCFSENWALNEIDSMKNSIKYIKDVTDEQMDAETMIDKFKTQIDKIKERLHIFKEQMAKQDYDKIDINKIENLYDLTVNDRWSLYFQLVASVKSELRKNMELLMEKHNNLTAELEEVSTLIDSDVMRTVRVVGVTTTLAARRHDLMRKLLSPIVIVEEAAEVLEAHIVASLTTHCQHLILIGDHKQLRPSAAHYKLAKHFNLEISLFERMIRNSIHAKTLTIQRRMRPQFVELLVPTIYEKLDSHPIVYNYPHIRGIVDTLYFYDHEVFEDSEGLEDSWSHKNSYEAEWCVALVNYLRKIGYKPEEITILTTYTGQATLIKEISKKYELLRDVRITVVDNYQGEESRIVILSLVRSNRDGNIGFLSAPNRICVALSRAKEGFYMFGNMKILMSASPIWRSINEKLKKLKAIGQNIALRCEKHNNILPIKNPRELDNCLIGTCINICKS